MIKTKMNIRVPYQVVITINVIICILVVINLLCLEGWDIPLIGLLYMAIISVTIRLLKQKLSIGIILITLYIQIVGPIEMLLLRLTPFNILGNSYIKYVELMNNRNAYWYYFFYSVLMYELVVFFCEIICFYGSRIRWNKISLNLWGIKKKILCTKTSNLVVLIIIALITYNIRIKYNLDVPGKLPSISHAGIIVYGYQSFGLLMLYSALKAAFQEHELSVFDYLYGIFACLIYGLPSMLLDQRAPFFRVVVVLILYTYALETDRFTRFAKKRRYLLCTGVVLFLSLYQFLTTYIRYQGQINVSILYFLSRLTGIGPGIIFFAHIDKVGTDIYSKFGLMDYIDNTFGSRSNSINKAFTHDILEFPLTAQHLSSIPTFVGSLFYHGIVGVVLFSIMYAIILGISDVMIRKGKTDYSKFLGSYLLVCTVMMLMGGAVEGVIELFAVPCIMSLMYVLLSSI